MNQQVEQNGNEEKVKITGSFFITVLIVGLMLVGIIVGIPYFISNH